MTRRRALVTALALLAVAALVFVGVGFATSHAGEHRSQLRQTRLGPPDGSVLAQLEPLVGTVSQREVEPDPREGRVYASTRRAANAVLNGAVLTDDSDVYVVVVRGHFTAARHPSDVPPTQGTVLSLTVDPATLRVLDMTISKQAPPPGALGAATPLP